MDTLPPDPYRALSLPSTATSAEIKSAYRRLALKYHPDKAGSGSVAAEQFHAISAAYEILGDEERRRAYDAEVRLRKLKEELGKGGAGGGAKERSSRDTGGTVGGGGAATTSTWAGPGIKIRTTTYSSTSTKASPSTASAGAGGIFFNYMDAFTSQATRKPSSPLSDRSSEENILSASFAANVLRGVAPFAAEMLGGYAKKKYGEFAARPAAQRRSSRQDEDEREKETRVRRE